MFQTGIIKAIAQNAHNYAVTADGKRFLINATSEEAASAPITVVENWLAGVKR